jgi:hypothetical protein
MIVNNRKSNHNRASRSLAAGARNLAYSSMHRDNNTLTASGTLPLS